MALLWRRAFKQAKLDLQSHGNDLRVGPGLSCPFDLDDFLVEDFDSDAALERILSLVLDGENKGRP